MILKYFEKENLLSLELTLKRWGWILLLSCALWMLMVYLNTGSLKWPEQHQYIELFLAWMLLEALYWSYIFIIYKLRPHLDVLPEPYRIILEFIAVLSASIICVFTFNYYPQFLIFGDILKTEANISNVRSAFIVAPITFLLLYYLLEGLRNRERLQKELLRVSTLEKENYKAQLELLKRQMSPHFLFNSLNVLTAIIPNNSEQALEYTHSLSDLYRYYLQSSEKELIPLQKELEFISSYQYLLETRFGKQLKFDLQIENRSDKYDWELPTGALHECIGNAVKHNGATKIKPLYITIKLKGHFICIENNKLPRREKVNSGKTGWKNIEERYRLLSSEMPYIKENKEKYTVCLPLLNPNSI